MLSARLSKDTDFLSHFSKSLNSFFRLVVRLGPNTNVTSEQFNQLHLEAILMLKVKERCPVM